MRAAGTLTALTLVAAALSGAAPPVPALCGSVLTSDVTLTADVTCPGAGVDLGPGVTLDLAGHTLRGAGTAGGTAVTGPAEGRASVRGGTLADWGVGVASILPGGLDVTDVTVTGTLYGAVQTSGELRLTRSALTDNRTGVRCSGAGRATTGSDCTLSDTTVTGGATAVDCYASRCTLTRATLEDADFGIAQVYGHVDVTDSLVRRCGRGQETVRGTATVLRTTFEENGNAIESVSSSVDLVDGVLRGNQGGYQSYGADGGGDVSVPHEVAGTLFVDNGVALDSGSTLLSLRFNVATGTGRGIDAPWATQTGWNIGMES